jgi:predicted PurR-regulated permease PerM
MGKVTGLNPAVILLSLSIWGSLMGMVGLIIALPVTTLIISYYKRFVLNDNAVTEEIKLADNVESENVDL